MTAYVVYHRGPKTRPNWAIPMATVVRKGFACKAHELNRELATHVGVKLADITRVEYYDGDSDAAEVIAKWHNAGKS